MDASYEIHGPACAKRVLSSANVGALSVKNAETWILS